MGQYVYIACSLDGFIAKPDGDIDWLTSIPNPTNDEYGYSQFIRIIDGIVMGRKTFEKVESFPEWPYSKPVFVLSNSMNVVPDRLKDKVWILSGKPKDIIDQLNARGMRNIYVDGGKTIQAFLKEGLIDEMIITTIAKILGDGVPLFGSIGVEIGFRVEKSEVLNEHMVKTYYKRK
ncbi:MAG: dihydrofolate reductase family protein [Spirochaetota bacterium]